MLKAKIGKEIVVRAPNHVGVLVQVSKVISDKGINILGASAWVEGSEALIRLITDEHTRALEALRQNFLSLRENEVVLSESTHKPGTLRRLAEHLAAKEIDLHYLYATAVGSQTKSLIVFACSDNKKAVVLLNG